MPKPACLNRSTDLPRHSTVSEKFSPRITELAEPQYDLTKNHALYIWQTELSQSFDDIRKEIVQAPILKYYDPKKETVLQTHASIKGLRAETFNPPGGIINIPLGALKLFCHNRNV